MKKIGMVVGVLIAVFGLSIMLTPLRTYFLIGWIAGIVLLFNGLSVLFSGLSKRGRSTSKCIIGGVTSAIGLALLVTDLQQVLTQSVIVYMVAGGIMLSGIIECVVGYVMVKNEQKATKTLVFGGISFVLGLVGLLYKDATVIIIGVIVGYHIVRVGISIFGYAKNIDEPIVLD